VEKEEKKKKAAAAEKEAAAAARREAEKKKQDDLASHVEHFDLFIRGLNEQATQDDVHEALKKWGIARHPIKLERTPSKRDDSILTLCFCCFESGVSTAEKDKRAIEIHDAKVRVKSATLRVERCKDKEAFRGK